MKFGLEIEKFVTGGDGVPFVIPKTIPHDSEGFQIEARGEPAENITNAVYSALADLSKISRLVAKFLPGGVVSDLPVVKVPRDRKLEARRIYAKGTLAYQNLYGHTRHAVAQNESTAGIHLSVTNPTFFRYSDRNSVGEVREREFHYFKMWDYCTFFRYLDKAFAEEIKTAKRKPGFYELKFDGRIEYRSLPTNIHFPKLIDVVEAYELVK